MKKRIAVIICAVLVFATTVFLPFTMKTASAEQNNTTAWNNDDKTTAVTDIIEDEDVYDTDSAGTVQVTFVCTPEESILTVYEETEEGTEHILRKVSSEKDGSYRLIPGSYLYSASAEGYFGLSEMPLTVEAGAMNLPIKVYVSLSMKPIATFNSQRSGTDMDADPFVQSQAPIITVITEEDDPDPEEPDEGELHAQQLIARAYNLYNNIIAANGSIEAYINLITDRKNSLQITLNQAQKYETYYSTYTKFCSTLVGASVSMLTKTHAEALVSVGKTLFGKVTDQIVKGLPKITTKEFIYSQAHEGLRSMSKDELWNVINRRNAGEELFPTAESAVYFILEIQNNKAAFASGEMGKDYFYDQINQSPWDTMGEIATDVAVSLISSKFKSENETLIDYYMRGKATNLIYNYFDVLVNQFSNPHITTWHDTLETIEKETEELLRYVPPYYVPEPVYHTVTFCTAEPYDRSMIMVMVYAENSDVYVPTPFRFGYDFLGWFDANGVEITEFNSFTSDMTLYSHWRRIVLESDLCGDNLVYKLYGDGLLEITGSGEMTSHPWTNQYADRVGEVQLPEGLTVICNGAFENCVYLHEVNVPSTVKTISEGAFAGSGLTSLTLPEGVEKLGCRIIENCKNLKELTVPGSITYMHYNAYGRGTFTSSCLEKVTISEGVTTLGVYAFRYCRALREVHLPSTLTEIKDYAFDGCTALEHIDLPESLLKLGSYAFASTGLTELTFPKNIETIGGYLLDKNTNVTYLFFPKTYRQGSDITAGSTVTKVAFEEGIETIPLNALENGTMLSEVILPSTVKTISEGAFAGSGLTSLTLPEGIEKLGCRIIENCENLKELTVPGSITYMHYNAYGRGTFTSSCLEKVTISEGVTTLGVYAFRYCRALREVHLPSTLTEIKDYAFDGCTALTDVYYQGTEQQKESYLHIANNNESLNNATWYYLTPAFTPAVEWNAEDVQFKGATPYVICNGSAQTPRFTVKNSADGSIVDPEFYDYEYRENTNAGTGYVIVTFKGDYTGECQGWFKIYLPATEHTYVENVSNGIKVTWDPVEGAAGYVIYRRAWSSTTNGWTDFVRWYNVTGTEWIDGSDVDHKVYAGSRYQYGVKAYFARRTDPVSGATIGGNVGDNFNLGEVGPLRTTVRITTRKLVQVRPGSKQMTVKWEASKNFTGYQIKYATDANFTKNVKAIKIGDPTTYWTTIKELQSNTTYYVCIRSYHEFGGMTYFGEWSNVLSCKVK